MKRRQRKPIGPDAIIKIAFQRAIMSEKKSYQSAKQALVHRLATQAGLVAWEEHEDGHLTLNVGGPVGNVIKSLPVFAELGQLEVYASSIGIAGRLVRWVEKHNHCATGWSVSERRCWV